MPGFDSAGNPDVTLAGSRTYRFLRGLLRLWFTLSRTYGRHLAFRLLTDPGRV